MNKDLQIAKKTVQIEIRALKRLLSSFNRSSHFSKAVNLLSKMKGKCLVVGVGKSYIVSLKVSATLSSLGTPSIAFSANDLQHGGLGAIQKKNDVLLIFSVSGESLELNSILRYANKNNISVIGVSCKATSMLLRNSTIKILLPRVIEAGHSLAPTSSSLNFLSWGDSLAITCMKRRKWSNKKFITTHPSGTLAKSLIQVKEIMAKGKEIPLVSANKTMQSAVKEMSEKKLGLVCCKEKKGKIYILTDGDLRRHSNNLFKKKILNVCSKNPTWISDTATALSAIEKMNYLKITSLLVARNQDINKKIKNIIGILHLHHCLSQGIK
jgi:arabinose-5-phosphate isomerase|tara:strand:+ start:97 stop:1071 length:975 start_codon:yes stop_codon:yes gene_type:complete